jgi:putative Holliday junction resolvase
MFNLILYEDSGKKAILAIDWGERRVGIAFSDDSHIMAHPYGTLENDDGIFAEIAYLAAEREVGLVLIGLPLTLDGEEGEMAGKVRGFGTTLSQSLPDISFEYIDERLSTGAAEKTLRATGKNAKAIKKDVDAIAAVLLLETYLELEKGDEEPAIDE